MGSLYLSAHLGDAVFSCAGAILADLAAGRDVTVLTLFSRSVPDSFFDTRRAEDTTGLAVLGAQGRQAGLIEATFRGVEQFEQLYYGGNADGQTLEDVNEAVAAAIRETKADRIYAPLAVGGHLDRRAVHIAAYRTDLWFYEDRPWAFVPEAVDLRLRDLGWQGVFEKRRPRLPTRASRYTSAFLGAPWVTSTLEGRRRTMRILKQRLGVLARRPDGPRVRPEVRTWDLSVLPRIREAVSCYEHPLTELVGDIDTWEAHTLRCSRHLATPGVYAERYWPRA